MFLIKFTNWYPPLEYFCFCMTSYKGHQKQCQNTSIFNCYNLQVEGFWRFSTKLPSNLKVFEGFWPFQPSKMMFFEGFKNLRKIIIFEGSRIKNLQKSSFLKVGKVKILQKPSNLKVVLLKTFKNLRLEGYNSRPGLACRVHLMSSLPLALGQLILFWQPRHSPIFVVSL